MAKVLVGALGVAAILLAGAGLSAQDGAAPADKLPRTVPAGIERVQTGEDPLEAEKIEAALVAQGYFRPDVPLPYDLQDFLHTACTASGVPYHVALGLIEVESGFDPEAVNGASGCYGLTQLSPAYFPTGLSPAQNLTAGVAYLGELLADYGDLPAALTAYHDGHDTGRRWYATAVLEAAGRWKLTLMGGATK